MTVLYTPSHRPPPRPVGPKTPAERADALLDVTVKLGSLIADEDAALAKGVRRKFGETIQRKQRLGFAFDELSRLLRVDRAGLAEVDPAVRERLKLALAELRTAAADQAARLRTTSEAHRRLVDTLVHVANVQRRADTHYAKGLGLTPPLRGGETPAASFNQRL